MTRLQIRRLQPANENPHKRKIENRTHQGRNSNRRNIDRHRKTETHSGILPTWIKNRTAGAQSRKAMRRKSKNRPSKKSESPKLGGSAPQTPRLSVNQTKLGVTSFSNLSPDLDSPWLDEDGHTFEFAQFILVLENHPFPWAHWKTAFSRLIHVGHIHVGQLQSFSPFYETRNNDQYYESKFPHICSLSKMYSLRWLSSRAC